MNVIINYFGIKSDGALVLLVVIAIALSFSLLFLIPFLKFVFKNLLVLLRFSAPRIDHLNCESYPLGNKRLIRLRWEVSGASTLRLVQTNEQSLLNVFKNNLFNQANLQKTGEAFIELDRSCTSFSVLFGNFWGNRRVDLSLLNNRTTNVLPSDQLKELTYRAYLQEQRIFLLNLFNESRDQRKKGTENIYNRFNEHSENVRSANLNQMESLNSVIRNNFDRILAQDYQLHVDDLEKFNSSQKELLRRNMRNIQLNIDRRVI